jgi:hypothetical protein
MNNTFDTITKVINSPPGQLLAAGGVLAGIVWKFFERVEAVLTDQTKLEIAVWLVGVQVGRIVGPWTAVFLPLFNRVFGEVHPSVNGFRRYYGVTMIFALLTWPLSISHIRLKYLPLAVSPAAWTKLFIPIIIFTVPIAVAILLIGYLTFCIVRWIVVSTAHFKRGRSIAVILANALSFTTGGLLVVAASIGGIWFLYRFAGRFPDLPTEYVALMRSHSCCLDFLGGLSAYGWIRASLMVYPLFLATLWLDLYATSGFIIRAARRFDIGFDWFNRKFDIEKKPLQSIGLVAGALVAAAYWTAVIVSRIVG